MGPIQNKVLRLLESIAMIEPDPGDRVLLHMATDTLREVWRETPAPQYTTNGLGPLTRREIVARVGKPVLVQAFPGARAYIGFVYRDPVTQAHFTVWEDHGEIHQLDLAFDTHFLIFDYVKRARWVHSCDKPTAYCSNCRGEVKDMDLPKCCPECGARMNAPEKEGENHA